MNGPNRRELLAGMAGLATLAATGCTRHRPANVLRVAFCPTTLTPLYRKIATAFERRHPGTRIELMPSVTYSGLMQRDFRLALIDDEPDVSHIGLNHIRFYVERGLSQPLGPLLAAGAPDPLTTHPTIGHVGGELHALPFALSVPVSYLNADLIRRHGRDPETLIGADWPDLLDAATAVSRAGLPLSGIFFDYYAGSGLAWQMLIASRGGRLMSTDERAIQFGGPAGSWSVELLRALGRAGQLDLSRENARMAFAAGQLGCYQNTSANVQRFLENATGYELIVAPLPMAPGGRLPAAGNAVAIVTRDERRHSLAWDYVRFACGPEAQTIMAQVTGYLTTNRAAIEDPRHLQGFLRRQPIYQRLYGVIDRLEPWYAFPGQRSEQITDEIGDAMRRLILGRADPVAELAAMVARTRELLPR
jgi:multiple sugar transport system substrate-binding protein